MVGKHCLRLPDITVWEMDITADIIAFIVHPTTTPASPTRAIPSLRLLQKADERSLDEGEERETSSADGGRRDVDFESALAAMHTESIKQSGNP